MSVVEKVLVLITGASRGFGKMLAIEVSKVIPCCDLLLVGRNLDGMKATQQEIQERSKQCSVQVHQLDLSALEELEQNLEKLLLPLKGKYSTAFIFSNSGSLGPLETIAELPDFASIRTAIDLNITSTILLNSKCIQIFSDCQKLRLVNISSLAAIKPIHSSGIYCIGKAARDMLMIVIAEESKDSPNVKSLNYAPGPMETEMQEQLRASKRNEMWVQMKAQVSLLEVFSSLN